MTEPYPHNLSQIDSPELINWLMKAVREKDYTHTKLYFEEIRRRRIKLSHKRYWMVQRLLERER